MNLYTFHKIVYNSTTVDCVLKIVFWEQLDKSVGIPRVSGFRGWGLPTDRTDNICYVNRLGIGAKGERIGSERVTPTGNRGECWARGNPLKIPSEAKFHAHNLPIL